MTSDPQVHVPVAGRLQYFYDQWQSVTDDSTILSWIAGYKIPFKMEPIQSSAPKEICRSETDSDIIDTCIAEMLKSEFISYCDPCDGQYLSPIFTVPKPNGKHRFILNLKSLNKYVQVEHFKMEDYRTALKLLNYNDYMATLDLKDAYFLISMDIHDRKKLRFQWKSQLYEFNVLPFGLCTAPYVFTKLLKPILLHLRISGHISVNYLDDFFCVGSDYQECANNVLITRKTLEYLGFIINYEKSQLTPNMCCKFLGFVFNTTNMTISLPQEKKSRIKESAKLFLHIKKCTIRKFAEFIGLLTSACPAVRYGWVYTKLFEREKFLSLNYSKNYNKIMHLGSNLRNDFIWWVDNIDNSFSSIKNDNYELEIYSDSSSFGWGVACNNDTASGNWNASELSRHINHLELKAAFYGLKIFAAHLANCSVLLRIDNTTAIAYINKMGGVQFTHLNELARDIWQWCEARNIYIFASYIRSADNIVADRASRQLSIDTEWALAEYAYKSIIDTFGVPNFDLFASIQNHKCERYASWKLDPQAEVIDAFTFKWTNIKFYAFPPFCLITKVIHKIITDRAEGIIVVPYWPSQPWYPIYSKLLVSEELYFNPDPSLLHSPFREAHPLHVELTLVAAKLSGGR